MANLLGIGLSGLTAHQTALATTGQNVTNTNTEGYSRQEVIFETRESQYMGAGYLGSGVSVDGIRRLNDAFITNQVRADATVFNEQDTLLKELSQLDNLLASETTGLSSAMATFFKSLQGAADDPTSIPERQLVLTQTEGLITRFQSLYDRFQAQSETLDQQMRANVSEINSLASGIAELNVAITAAIGNSGQNKQPNELLDQRELLLKKLSEIVQITVVPQDSGQINVLVGNGQALVVGSDSATMSVTFSPDDPTRSEIAFQGPTGDFLISEQITGGKLGGLLRFRDEVLDESFNSLGRIAVVLADTINDQHEIGMDLDDNLGGLFFSDVNERLQALNRVIPSSNNALPNDRIALVEITDPSKLTTQTFDLQFTGPTAQNYTLKDHRTGELIQQGALPPVLPVEIALDGFTIVLESGSFQVGDKFLIQPVRYGARDIDRVVDSVRELALASPVKAEAELGNTGDAVISQGKMLDVRNPLTNQLLPEFSVPRTLTPPMVVRFLTEDTYEVLDATDPANLVPLDPPLNNQRYVPGIRNELFTDDPGQTVVSALGTSILSVPAAAVASPGPYTNGYAAQTMTVSQRDPETGLVTQYVVTAAANDSARTTAAQLNQIAGIQATAYTHVQLTNFTDNGDATPPSLVINGETFTFAPPAVFSPDAFVDAINDNANLKALGIFAVSTGDSGIDNLVLRSTTGADITVEVVGGGDSVDVEKINPYDLTTIGTVTVNDGEGVAIGGYIDLKMSQGTSLIASNADLFTAAPVATSSYRGFLMDITGPADAGDRFDIGYNNGGISDNRNVLAMVGLETAATIDNSSNTYNEGYAQLVEYIGTATNRTRLDQESSEALLKQSEVRWQEKSGVNLDEEAGRLIQYQSAYNASAQVISVARELFDTLLGAFR